MVDKNVVKKVILPFFFVCGVVLVLLVKVTPAPVVADSNERFSDGKYEYTVQREGNNITLTSTTAKIPRAAGIPNLVGMITGTTFTGKVYLIADDCPNLDGYVPASGTVSADGSISVTYKTSQYYYKTCVEKPNSEFEVSSTYTLASAENTSPTPFSTSQPTQSEKQPIKPSDVPESAQLPSSQNQAKLERVPALVDAPPRDSDIDDSDWVRIMADQGKRSVVIQPFMKQQSTELFFANVQGEAHLLLPDGTTVIPKSGEFLEIPLGTTFIVPEQSRMKVAYALDSKSYFPRGAGGIMTINPRSQIQLKEFSKGAASKEETNIGMILEVQKGTARFKGRGVEKSWHSASETGVMLGTKGTDYGMSYNPETKKTIVEIYDGTVEIIDQSSNQVLATLSTTYNGEIKQVEINENKVIQERIAIPKSEWDAFLTSNKKQPERSVNTTNPTPFLVVIVVLALGGGVFFLYRTGKLVFLYKKYIQKTPVLHKKNDNKNPGVDRD